jgi:hypothetical protein
MARTDFTGHQHQELHALQRNVTAAQGKLTDLESQVSAQTGKWILPAAGQLLIADANYVLGTLQ